VTTLTTMATWYAQLDRQETTQFLIMKRTLHACPGGRQHYTEVRKRNAEAENSVWLMACTSDGPNVKVNKRKHFFMTTSIFHIVRMISIYPMHTSPNTNSKGLGMLYVNSVKHIGEPTKCCHKWHNKHGGESNLEQCVQETIENLGLKTKKRTCGTAILSRLAA